MPPGGGGRGFCKRGGGGHGASNDGSNSGKPLVNPHTTALPHHTPNHCTAHTHATKALAWQGDRWLSSFPPPARCLASPYHPRGSTPSTPFVRSIHPPPRFLSLWLGPQHHPPTTPTRDLLTGVAAVLSVLLARRAAHPLRAASALRLAPLPPPRSTPFTLHSISPLSLSPPPLPKLVPNLCALV